MRRFLASLAICLTLVCPLFVYAQETAASSPKAPWGDFEVIEQEQPTVITKVLLWLPNRLLDLWDIFRVDAGAGVGYGAVLRLTTYGQLGYRSLDPGMLRLGADGRESPVFVESSKEYGIGPYFVESKDRNLCTGVVGAGVDVVLVGAHVGICPEEIFDFLGGIFLFDPMGDDLK